MNPRVGEAYRIHTKKGRVIMNSPRMQRFGRFLLVVFAAYMAVLLVQAGKKRSGPFEQLERRFSGRQ